MDLTGRTFGMLTVIKFIGIIARRSMYLCQCSCGKATTVKAKYLLNGDTKSCGCLKTIMCAENGKNTITHGLTKHPLYKVWSSMKDRCLNKKCHAYKHYGGRGIGISEDWLQFQKFYDDVF